MLVTENNNHNDWTRAETFTDGKPTFKSTCQNIFKEIFHKDSTTGAVLLFIALCTINILSVKAGYGYWYFVEPWGDYLPSIVTLAFWLAGFILFTVYTIICCRKKLKKHLTAITTALGLIALGSVITSGIFYPIFNALGLVFRYVTNTYDPESTVIAIIPYALNIIALIIYVCLTFHALYKSSDGEVATYRFSSRKIAAILFVICATLLVLYGFAFAEYEYEEFNDDYYTEASPEYQTSRLTAEQRNLYDGIKNGDDATETEKELLAKGFVKQEQNYEDFIYDCLFPYYIDDYLNRNSPENAVTSKYAIYCYSHEMEEPESWDDIISCIIISYDPNGKINYKLFIPNADGCNTDGYYLSYEHGKQTREWFDNIKNGESSACALEFIRSTGATIIEAEKCEGEIKINTYKIILQCYYPLEVDFCDFLLNRYADNMSYFYDFEITTADDAVVKKQEMHDYDY